MNLFLGGILSAVRNVQTSSALFENSKNKSSINPFYFNMCGYNKYGLLHDDLLNFEDPDVKEAVRRLPEQMKMERAYRAIQAFQVELHHDVLPKDKWTKPDDVIIHMIF